MSDTPDLDKAREAAGKLHDKFYCDICHGAKDPDGCAEREANAVTYLRQRAEEAERCAAQANQIIAGNRHLSEEYGSAERVRNQHVKRAADLRRQAGGGK